MNDLARWCIAGIVALGVIAFSIDVQRKTATPRPPRVVVPVDEPHVTSGPHPFTLVSEPLTMQALEQRGLGLNAQLGAAGDDNAALARSPIFAAIARVLEADLAELGRRPNVGGEGKENHPFEPSWLRDQDARFELIGIVPRLDRAFAEAGTCGEIRLVYRLALERPARPMTRLPMTLSLLHIVPSTTSCATLARRVLDLPASGAARVSALVDLVRSTASKRRIEVNLQNLHGPATMRDGEDHAEYLLRSFDLQASGATERPLLATPRGDLSATERDRLAEIIRERFDDVDRGVLALPPELLAKRAISVSPRGLARVRNRVFLSLFGKDVAARFGDLPYASARVVRSPRALLRRLDQGTCQGCHQSRAVAGFHLLGEERHPRSFNALFVGQSSHLSAELPWREELVRAIAAGTSGGETRPFAERGNANPGVYGERCGLGDPGFAAYGCGPGLVCKDDRGDELGACAHADANYEGDACERADVTVQNGPEGDHLAPHPSDPCRVNGRVVLRDACMTNGLGFPGGACTDGCPKVGAIVGNAICIDVPNAGYEMACFHGDQSIERCLENRTTRSLLRACDLTHPCRDDYACARTPGERGACVPPYFVFQARVDGPRADR